MQIRFNADKHRIMSLEAKKKKEDYLLMEMSCTVLTRNEIWGIIAGEISQAFNPFCCNGKVVQ